MDVHAVVLNTLKRALSSLFGLEDLEDQYYQRQTPVECAHFEGESPHGVLGRRMSPFLCTLCRRRIPSHKAVFFSFDKSFCSATCRIAFFVRDD
jgi:hypothetical protein